MSEKLTRKERDYLRHKSEIIETAEELFAEKGYYNVTMEMIAKKAEYSKGALYNYFESKEVLFFNILNNKTEILEIELHKRVSEVLTIVDKLNAFVEFYLDFFSENISFFRIAETEKYNLTNFTQKKMIIILRKKYFNHLEEIRSIVTLNQKIKEEESNLIALAISGILNGLLTRNLLYDDKIEIEQIKLFAKNKTLKLIE
jgi:AcrR family transcriptional regulator